MTSGDQAQLQAVENSFVAFADACLARLRVFFAAEGSPLRYSEHIHFADSGHSWGYQTHAVPDYGRILANHWIEFGDLPEANACIEAHDAAGIPEIVLFDSENHPIPQPTLSQAKDAYLQHLHQPLHSAISHFGTLDLSHQQLIEVYRVFRDSWLSRTQRYIVTIPLIGLISAISRDIALTHDLSVGPFTSQEKATLWDRMGRFHRETVDMIPNLMTLRAMSHRLQGAEEYGLNQFDAARTVGNVHHAITALRLRRSGFVGATLLYRRPEQLFMEQLSMGAQGLEYTIPPHLARAGMYTLQETDIPAIQGLMAILQRANVQHVLGVAFRRFNQSYGRSIIEDRIIDLAIALESILVRVEDELSYKFALRGAALLARKRNPKETYQLLSAIYTARSKIVHNDQALMSLKRRDLKNYEPGHLPMLAERVTADILVECAERLNKDAHLTAKTLIQSIEDSILVGLRCRQWPATPALRRAMKAASSSRRTKITNASQSRHSV